MENSWEKIKDLLQQEIGTGGFTLWFSQVDASLEGSTLTLYPPTEYASSRIRAKYDIVLQAVCFRILGFVPTMVMKVVQKKKNAPLLQRRIFPKEQSNPALQNSSPNPTPPTHHEATLENDRLHYMQFSLERCADLCSTNATKHTTLSTPDTKEHKTDTPYQPILITDSLKELERSFPSSFGMPIPEEQISSHSILPAQEYMNIEYKEKRPTFNYNFNSFLVGTCNMLAHASSKALCENSTNPLAYSLYLSSTPGLGKTHLMQALGQELILASNRRQPRIEYLSAEDLTTQFTMAMQQKNISQFLNRLKNADVFLLEDVHFLQGKERMQAQLLHVIKALQNRGAKIVFSSSFSLKEIRDIDSQLASCFQDGYVAHISQPDIEFRKEIIRRKAHSYQIIVPEAVTQVIAENICSDIRRIEGCLKTIILKARAMHEEISLAMVLDVLSTYNTTGKKVTFEDILHVVCKAFSISRERLVSKTRQKECVFARNLIFYLARVHTDMTLKEVANSFNRQHSTVIKGVTSIEHELAKDSPRAKQILSLFSLFENTYSSVCA